MLRVGNIIRMTEAEIENFRAMTGRPEIPQTVEAYNRAIDVAVSDWEGTGCDEGLIMAELARDLKIAVEP